MTTTPPPATPADQPETELTMAERRWADEYDCTCPTVGAGYASDCPTHGTATTEEEPPMTTTPPPPATPAEALRRWADALRRWWAGELDATPEPPALYAVLSLDDDSICVDPDAAQELAAELTDDDDDDRAYAVYRLVPLDHPTDHRGGHR